MKVARKSGRAWWVLSSAALLCAGVIAMARRAPERSFARTPSSLSEVSERVSIDMYSASWCSACARAKEFLDREHVHYREIDVEQRAGAMTQLAALNPARTLPTFDVQGHVLVGFVEPRLRRLIEAQAIDQP